MIELAHTSRVLCRLCLNDVALRVEAMPDALTEAEIDEEVMRRARVAGILPVELPHMGKFASEYQRRPWICSDCASCVAQVFAIDANSGDTNTLPPTTYQSLP